MAYSQPRLGLLDTTTQLILTANTEQVVTFNTVVGGGKIMATSSSRFTIVEPGRYLVIGRYSGELGSGVNKTLNLWAKVNGTNVANTNHIMTLDNPEINNQTILMGITLATSDYLELWMQGDDTTLQLKAIAAGGNIPVTPSINIAIYKFP